VWWVDSYEGQAESREGQPMQWVSTEALDTLSMPAADKPIIAAIGLPRFYTITPDCDLSTTSLDDYLETVSGLMEQPMINLLQLRCPALSDADYRSVAQRVLAKRQDTNTKVILNTDPETAVQLGADGVHLSSQRLDQVNATQLQAVQSRQFLVGASCHNQTELKKAQALKVDFAVLGSVKETPSHPGVKPIGWDQFKTWVSDVVCPVYAIGGLTMDDYAEAIQFGAQGIAGISTFEQLVSIWSKMKTSKLMQ
jgi:8-oxo-dGTP diphosphatase